MPLNNPVSERVEPLVAWAPGLAGGTDLEAGSTIISATAEPGAPDYSTTHNVIAPTDARIIVARGVMRLSITGTFGGGGATLNYIVKRGGVAVKSGTFTADGAHLISWDITTLITGSQVNTIFLWVGAGTFTVTEITLWSAVGSMQASRTAHLFSLTFVGTIQLTAYVTRVGTGTYLFTVMPGPNPNLNYVLYSSAGGAISAVAAGQHNVNPGAWIYINTPTVATDLPYISDIYFLLKSPA